MIGHARNILFSLSLMGSLVLPTFGEGTQQYLRRKTDSLDLPKNCDPVPMISTDDYEYNSKVYVLLELEESTEIINPLPQVDNPLPQVDTQSFNRLVELGRTTENNEIVNPNAQDIQSVAKVFVGAYDMLTPCFNTFGAERYIVSAEIVDADNLRNEGSFTQLIEIKMACNSCGNEGTWQLFEGTRVGLPAAVSSYRKADIDENECVCGGPVQTNFLETFTPLVTANNKSISVLNAIQIPLLVSQDGTYNEELCSTTEEYKTTYSYAGVCPAKPTESPSASPSASPTDLPTTVSPTESPTDFPTDSPTSFPTDFPTDTPSDVSSTSSDE